MQKIEPTFFKSLIPAAILLIVGLLCFALFQLIGSTVDEKGFVHEPFFLLPIGWLLVFAAITTSIIQGLRRLVKNTRR